jgi:outer membrane protein W
LTCDITFGGRTTFGLGFQVMGVSLYYGIQGAAMSSIAAPTVATVALPSAGGSASGSTSVAGGTYTVTPSTLQTNTTTSGNCYNEQVAFGTPFTYANNTKISFDQVFTTPGTTAVTLQICGLKVYGNWIQ